MPRLAEHPDPIGGTEIVHRVRGRHLSVDRRRQQRRERRPFGSMRVQPVHQEPAGLGGVRVEPDAQRGARAPAGHEVRAVGGERLARQPGPHESAPADCEDLVHQP